MNTKSLITKQVFISAIVALLVSSATFWGFYSYNKEDTKPVKIEHVSNPLSSSVLYAKDANGELVPMDFTKTAEQVVNAVVHIKSSMVSQNQYGGQYQYRQLPDPFRDFFGEEDDIFKHFFGTPNPGQQPPQGKPRVRVGTGSGVIINANGYIVTNNHVIANADDIEVTLHDNRTYKATVVGTDPSTDLALLQIKEKDLPTLKPVNSDDVKIGEWVLAVGNPFSLNSTVTAGIISAKARNINILKEQYAIESFIQTDAAINPGNSGGALVNLSGDLIGINTAIASPTGAYSGYGFAVPSNIVNKVVQDLLEYGVVQRGVLGVMIRSVNGNLAKEKELEINNGAYVDSLLENSAAGKAGIEPGDVIVAVDDNQVASSPELQELIAQRRPGDVVKITVNRKGKEKTFDVTLRNKQGKTDFVKKEHKEILSVLGCELQKVDRKTAKKLEIHGGVKVSKLYAGKLKKHTQIKEGFIITHIDNKKVSDVDEVIEILNNKEGGILIEGVYEDIPGKYYFALGL